MLYLLNTTFMPNEGVFVNRKITLDEAKNIFHNHVEYLGEDFTSAIGHQGTADAFNALGFARNISVNRIPATMNAGDEAIALKVLGRLPEGEILDFDALDRTGFEFYHIQNLGLTTYREDKSETVVIPTIGYGIDGCIAIPNPHRQPDWHTATEASGKITRTL